MLVDAATLGDWVEALKTSGHPWLCTDCSQTLPEWNHPCDCDDQVDPINGE